jgi:chromosome segregation protein
MIKRKSAIEQADLERTTLKAKIASSEADIEKMQLHVLEKEKELECAAKNVSEANERIIALDRDISVSRERCSFSVENSSRCDREANALDEQIENSTTLKIQIEKALIDQATEFDACTLKVVRSREELAAIDARVQDAQQSTNRLATEQIEIINEAGEQRNIVSSLKTNLSNSLERIDHDEREIDTLEERAEEYQDAINTNRNQLLAEQEAHQHLQASRDSLLSRIDSEDEKYQKLVAQEKQLEAQIDSNKQQLKFLEGLDAAFEGYDAGVKTLLTNKKQFVDGIVADLIKVADEQNVCLIERILGTAVQTVVFKTDAQLAESIDYLNNEKCGAASMVSLERLGMSAARTSKTIPGATSLRCAVTTGNAYTQLADQLFGNLWSTDTSAEAMKFSQRYPDDIFISADGTICRQCGIVIAGTSKKQQVGLLQRKRQIEKLVLDTEQYQKDYESVIQVKEHCIINRDEAKVALVEINDKINRGRQKQQEQETTIRHFDNEIRSIGQKVEQLQGELAQTRQRTIDMEQKIRDGDTALEELLVRQTHIEERVEKSKTGSRDLQQERNQCAEHLKNIELEMMGLTNRLNQGKSDIERLSLNVKNYTAKKEKIVEEKRRAESEILDIEGSLTLKNESLIVEQNRREQLQMVRDGIREDYAAMQIQLDESRKNVRMDQANYETVANSMHALDIDQTRDEQEQRRIRERIWQAYELDLETPPEGLPVIEDEDAAVTENIAMFKERLRRLGEVNMAALADFETENARLTELTAQRDDLQTAVDELDKAIKKLDREARIQFVATFEQVQKNFTTMFTTLFEGGEAHVTLEENVDPLEAAIHINVRPGGKKMRGVSLLSGGERALTAISLLFALYLVKPSAYCILDELDAPLDDANIGRFINILRKFSEQTQFIVVTHNKRTMEAADILYGVTQQESGVSSVVSVKVTDDALQAA